jgi:hypothetical protein
MRRLTANDLIGLQFVTGTDGHKYLLDPNYRLAHLPHRMIPVAVTGQASPYPGLSQGLGATPLEQGGIMALNFVPGVGPILSAVASLAEGIFGGGDPTPEWKLSGMVLQLRQQLKEMHDQLGIADTFALSGPIGSGQDGEQIKQAVTFALGHPGSGPTWRKDLYTAIQNLQGMVHDAELQLAGAGAVQQYAASQPPPPSTSAPGPAAQPPATVPDVPDSAPGAAPFDVTPLIWTGAVVGGIVVLTALAGALSSRGQQ